MAPPTPTAPLQAGGHQPGDTPPLQQPATATNASGPTPAPPATTRPSPPQVTALRLPPFAADDPELWLAQVECALGVAGITNDLSRYQVLASSLPADVASQVRDVITCSAPTYSSLTSALRQRLAHSRSSRLEALLRNQHLGDQRPSQLLRRMQGELSAAGDAPADSGLLRTLFLQRLPQVATAALSLLPETTPLEDLASSADRFLEASRPASSYVPAAASLSSLAQPPLPVPPAPAPVQADLAVTVATLTASIDELQMEIRSMRQQRTEERPQPQQVCYRCRSQSRGRQARRSDRSPSASRSCYYHQRFGSQAKKCQAPCSWAGNESA